MRARDLSPSKFRLRRIFRRTILRIAKPLASFGVRPDTVTYFTLFLSLCAVLVLKLSQSQLIFGLLVFLVGFFDGVDGAVARLRSQTSQRGAFIDSIVDRVSDVFLLFGVLLTYPTELILGITIPIWTLICTASWLITSYTRSRAESLGAEDLDVGIGGRSERLFTLFVFSIFSFLLWGLFFVTIIGITTAAFRVYHYTGQLSSPNHSEPNHQT
jgi:archaetidylinositol phosphate synthase